MQILKKHFEDKTGKISQQLFCKKVFYMREISYNVVISKLLESHK